MIIIPAIDILDNEAVRLYKGDYSQKTVYSKAPWELIMAFEKTGAKLVHIVDLNGARNASDTNRDTIIKMKKACPELKIELGGGIRDMEKLKFYEGLGIDRFILGTAAVIYPDFLEAALKYVGKERLVVSVDAFEGIVRIAGWEEKTKLTYMDLMSKLSSQGIQNIVFTDISHDGTLSGPNLNSYREILDSFDFDLIASGGISSMKDILDLTSLQAKKNLYGIITGKAIYEGRLNLQEAIDSTK